MGVVEGQKILVSWHIKNKGYYEKIGYKFTKFRDSFYVDVGELNPTSNCKVKAVCDYCGDNKEVVYNTIVGKEKYKCKKCAGKEKHSQEYVKNYLKRYECKLISAYKEALSEIEFICKCGRIGKNTFNRFTYHPYCRECRKELGGEKFKKTFKDKTNEEKEFIQEKRKNTLLDKYGVDNVQKIKEVKEKTKKTNTERYGFPYVMMNKDILKKSRRTLNKNGDVKCSFAQKHIHKLTGGVLNKFIDGITVDIALDDYKIYIEYDGGGHTLPIKIGQISEEEFYNNERRREFYLKEKGWKLLRIKSNEDKLPNNKILRRLIEECIEVLNRGRTYCEINIDKSCVLYKGNETHVEMGTLNYYKHRSK